MPNPAVCGGTGATVLRRFGHWLGKGDRDIHVLIYTQA